MKYALMIHQRPEAFAEYADPVRASELQAAWAAFTRALLASGVVVTGAGLAPPNMTTTVRIGGADDAVQDGPFADTKEMLGGFYIIDVPDLDAALQWAARIPAPSGSSIEVRPVIAMPTDY